MSDENLAEIRNEKAKKIQYPKGKLTAYERPVSYTHLTLPTNREV